MFRFRKASTKDATVPQKETIVHAGETCSVAVALAGRQLEEEIELKLKGLTDSVARVAPSVEDDMKKLRQIDKTARLNGALIGDCKSFVEELIDLDNRVVDAVCNLAEEIEHLL